MALFHSTLIAMSFMWNVDMRSGKKGIEKREKEELDRAVQALYGAVPNPIAWAPVIKLVAPIIARIAARYVLKLVARKLDRRISSKIREETVMSAADYLADIVIRRTAKK